MVDLTAFGRYEFSTELLEHVKSYFPSAPLLVLSTAGNQVVEEQLPSIAQNTLFWRQAYGDKTPFAAENAAGWSLMLAELPDTCLGERLQGVSSKLRDFRQSLERQAAFQKKFVSPLYKLLRLLRGLVTPFDDLEQHLDRHRRSGPYPILPCRDVVGFMDAKAMPTQEARLLLEEIVNDLSSLFDYLSHGQTGKAQGLARWMEGEENQHNLIVTSSAQEANQLRDWLLPHYYELMSEGAISVMGASSVMDAYKCLSSKNYDRILVLGDLWKDRHWILQLPAKITWLAYSYELPWLQRVAGRCSKAQEGTEQHKIGWWLLEDSAYQVPERSDGHYETTYWSSCTGQYKSFETIVINLPSDPDWLAKLVSDLSTDLDEPSTAGLANIPTEKSAVAIVTDAGNWHHYGKNQTIHVLQVDKGEENLQQVACQDVAVGDYLVTVDMGEGEADSLVDVLIDYVVDHADEYKMAQTHVDNWFRLVDHAINKLGSEEKLQAHLSKAGVSIGVESVRRWGRHIGISPNNKTKVVPAVMRAGGNDPSTADVKLVTGSQRKILGLHTQMGKLLRELVLSSWSETNELVGNASKLVDRHVLTEMLSIEIISDVRIIDVEKSKPSDNACLTSTLEIWN